MSGSENATRHRHRAAEDPPVRRVLMVACAFPPTGGAGVQRTLKFAKYLRAHGWMPIVWSAPSVPHLPPDPSMCDELPRDVEHLTGPTFDPVARTEKMFAPLIRRMGGVPRLASKLNGLQWRLGATGRRVLDLAVPDAQLFWALRSYRRLRRIIRSRRVSVIFSSYSPASNHLLASWLKRASGLPWIADFRDLWTDDEAYPIRSRLRLALDRRLEGRFLREADAVTATTDGQRDRLAEKAPDQREKFHVISNGVDFEDMDRAARLRTRRGTNGRRDTFRLVFAGQLQSTRVTDDYFAGIARFLAGAPALAGRFEFRVVGRVSQGLREAARRHGVHVATTGYLPHVEAIREMLDADVLLLPAPRGDNADWLMPAKVYEYAATGRPILMVGPARALVSRFVTRACEAVVTPCRVDAIATALSVLWKRRREGNPLEPVDRHALAPFDRNVLAGRLADLLDEFVHPLRGEKGSPAGSRCHTKPVPHEAAVTRASSLPPSTRPTPSPSVPPVCIPEEVAR